MARIQHSTNPDIFVGTPEEFGLATTGDFSCSPDDWIASYKGTELDLICNTPEEAFAEAERYANEQNAAHATARPVAAVIVPPPQRPSKPTQLQQGILYAAADLARYVVQAEDVAALLRRQGLADADCSDLEEMDKQQLRVLRDDFDLPLRGLD